MKLLTNISIKKKVNLWIISMYIEYIENKENKVEEKKINCRTLKI